MLTHKETSQSNSMKDQPFSLRTFVRGQLRRGRSEAEIASISAVKCTDLYRPLSPSKKEIRILVVENGAWDEPIQANFEYISLLPDCAPVH